MTTLTMRTALSAVTLALLAACSQPEPESATAQPRLATAVLSVPVSNPFEVTGIQKLGEARVSRTVYDFTFRVTVRNSGSDNAAAVKAVLSRVPAGVTLIDAEVAVGNIAAGASVSPLDTIVLRVNRSIAFNPAALTWDITSSAVKQLDPVKPAEVVELSLADLGLPDSADKVSVSGAVTDVLIKDGTLRFSTPADTGALQQAEFILVKGGTNTILSLTILSDRPSQPLLHVEANEDGAEGQAEPTLTVSGLGPNNSFVGNSVTFRLKGAPTRGLALNSDGLVTGPNKVRLSLKPYWTYNPADTSFTIDGTKLQELMTALPPAALEVTLNFVSDDREFAVVYEMLAIRQATTLHGKLVTPEGQAVTTLAGKKMLLHGVNHRLREVVTVDANGSFTFTNVIPDTYHLTLNDLENPNVVSASTLIQPNATTASLSIVYSLGGAPQAM